MKNDIVKDPLSVTSTTASTPRKLKTINPSTEEVIKECMN